jgi:hypothetical protein
MVMVHYSLEEIHYHATNSVYCIAFLLLSHNHIWVWLLLIFLRRQYHVLAILWWCVLDLDRWCRDGWWWGVEMMLWWYLDLAWLVCSWCRVCVWFSMILDSLTGFKTVEICRILFESLRVFKSVEICRFLCIWLNSTAWALTFRRWSASRDLSA